jgi:hypothetical protein
VADTAKLTAYMITHGIVGGHFAGEIVTFSDADLKRGLDPDRLMRIGAIREATKDEADGAVKFGQTSDAYTPVFPPVPYAPTSTEGPATQVIETQAAAAMVEAGAIVPESLAADVSADTDEAKKAAAKK